MFKVTAVRHAYPERAGFIIDRKFGHRDHTFLHFFNQVELLVGGKKVITEPNACVVFPAGQVQYFFSKSPLTHDWFHFMGDVEEIRKCGIEPSKIYYPTKAAFVTESVKKIENEFNSGFYGREEMISLKIKELFINIKRDKEGELSDEPSADMRKALRAFRGEVLTNLDKKQTIKEMAKKNCMSESRFFRVYKAVFGISPIEDIISARINNAKNMLLFTDITVTDIANALGYENLTHFIRQFKSRTGKSPAEYRKEKKE